jgi:hypothetical protein
VTPERWRRITEIFHAALARDEEARDALLDEACAGDLALRGEVEAMLAAHEGAKRSGQEPAPAFPDEKPRLEAGGMLGPYRIEALIGAGGMGEVYRARDTRLDRTVALKVLPLELTGDAERRGRFEREARAIARLSHPHICTLYDVGRDGATDFLVMEHLEPRRADRLRARLQDGSLRGPGNGRRAPVPDRPRGRQGRAEPPLAAVPAGRSRASLPRPDGGGRGG